MSEELVSRKLVRPIDLNSADRLFGGQMLSWIDDTAAVYAMVQLNTTSIVTARVSEVNFLRPALQGDMLEFYASTVKIGRTSLTVRMRVIARKQEIVDCTLVFVAIDANGKPTLHCKEELGL
jgi:uncharacterized protein (TIGR00369 family)